MNHIPVNALLFRHLAALTGYIDQLTQYPITGELKENITEIARSMKLFEQCLSQLPTHPQHTSTDALRTLCHDLRNPINVMNGYTEMSLEMLVDVGWVDLKTFFKSIMEINQQLLRLVNMIVPAPETGPTTVLQPEEKKSADHTSGTILVVEDNDSNRNLLFTWLSNEGYQVYQAANGDAALTQLAMHSNIDAVLLDIRMPGKDGYEVLKEIRSNKTYSETVVVMLTAIDDIDKIVSCVKAGAEDYVTKPFNAYLLGTKIKSNIQKKRLRYQSMHNARYAGMADVAIYLLHNVGNVLNSLNVSASLVTEKIQHSKMSELQVIKKSLHDNKSHIADFIEKNEQGQLIPEYIAALSDYWESERETLLKHLSNLHDKINHVRAIVAEQQSLAKSQHLTERMDLAEVIDSALAMQKDILSQHGIIIERNYIPLKAIVLDKIKLLQIIMNLITNARDALLASKNNSKKIIINFKVLPKERILVQFIDTGIGISEDNLTKLFFHGFTTKTTGRGFGLHGSALAAAEMRGNLTCESNGIEKGACFNLELPLSS